MNIAADVQQVVVPIHHQRLIALLEDVPALPMPPIKREGKTGLQRLHELGQIPLGSLQQQMEVIG